MSTKLIYSLQDVAREFRIPEDIQRFVKCPKLLPGENEDEFSRLLAMLLRDLDPSNHMEWLFVIDIAVLLLDCQRHRRQKEAVLALNYTPGMADALRKAAQSEPNSGASDEIVKQAGVTARKWRDDPAASAAIEDRLSKAGYDADALSAMALLKASDHLIIIDRFFASARKQMTAALREINIRREFARRARKTFAELVDEAKIKSSGLS